MGTQKKIRRHAAIRSLNRLRSCYWVNSPGCAKASPFGARPFVQTGVVGSEGKPGCELELARAVDRGRNLPEDRGLVGLSQHGRDVRHVRHAELRMVSHVVGSDFEPEV